MLSNSAVAALSSLSSLTSLELPGDWVKTAGAHAIASLANLQSLKMPGAEQVGSCLTCQQYPLPSHQVTSADLIKIVSSLHNLRILDFSDAKKGGSDSVVAALSAANPNLEYLALDECERITGFKNIYTMSCFYRISHLGKGLRGLADNCHKLQHLSLDGCYQVNDPSIVRLATSCTQLTYLSLGLCSTVKDTSLKALATHCPRLAHLNLFGCAYISERGVARLVEALGPRDLNYLCIRGMLGVGQTFSERLVKDWPRMEVVHTFLPRPQRYACLFSHINQPFLSGTGPRSSRQCKKSQQFAIHCHNICNLQSTKDLHTNMLRTKFRYNFNAILKTYANISHKIYSSRIQIFNQSNPLYQCLDQASPRHSSSDRADSE